MTIQELQREKILSRKTNATRSIALGTLLDTAKKLAKEEKRDVEDRDIVIAAKRNIKSLTSVIEELKTGDLVDKYKDEIKIYKEFLPKMVEKNVLIDKIDYIINSIPESERSMKFMGKIISTIKQEFGDSADMSIVSKIAKERLS